MITTDQTRALTRVVDRAITAPSVHNTQPWRFEVTATRLTLLADQRRKLRVLDPTDRQLVLSCGCALLNARVAAAHRALPVRVTRFPDGPDSDVLARLDLCDTYEPGRDVPADTHDLAELNDAMSRRQTNRRRFENKPVPRALLDTLRFSAEREGAIALEIRTDQDRLAIAQLSQRADALQFTDPAYRAELRAWTSDDPTRRDGVPALAVPHVDAGSGDEIPIRDFDTRGAGFLPTNTASTRNQCLILLGTEADDRPSWLRAGEALERMLLEITRAGLAASPLRVGYAPRTPGTSRRAIEDVLHIGPDVGP